MKRLFTFGLLLVSTFLVDAEEAVDLNKFAQHYYSAMTATQAPNASEKELEAYLSLLTDDVGSQHIPY
mgnify:FL=1